MQAPDDTDDGEILEFMQSLTDEGLVEFVEGLPENLARYALGLLTRRSVEIPTSPLAQAQELNEGYRDRPHLSYLSDRLAKAVADVEAGQSRFVRISMPPRMGKSSLSSIYFPLWVLRKHPDWRIGLLSHSPALAVSWGREVRRAVENHGEVLGLQIAKDAGAVSEWQTTSKGGIVSRSAPGQSITGLGFRVLIADDLVKDYAAAHSEVQREALRDYWRANAVTRLETPALVLAIGTRWHEKDFIGGLTSTELGGDPDRWEVIELPAIAEDHDVLGRAAGEPLFSPLQDETTEEALARWGEIRESVGSYAWAALYQQRPAPARGAVFDSGWWRFWTTDPSRVDGDRVVLFDPEVDGVGARWLDSWDAAFKGGDSSDFVVGQRWCRKGANRFLVDQQRGRWSFTETIRQMEEWAGGGGWAGSLVHERLIEEKANGAAIIDTLKDKISGLIPVNPQVGKEARARAVTPEIEAGNVFLPLPDGYGNAWVNDLLDELRNFPHGAHDDQVDAMTQALSRLRVEQGGSVVVPGRARVGPVGGFSAGAVGAAGSRFGRR